MKKLLKRFICIVLTIILLFSTISVNAYTSHSAAEAVSWANSLIGKSVDYDGDYGAQCVDLIAYYYQYLGTQTPGGSAYKYATNKLPDGWNRIPYYNGFVAQPGDIAVWTYAASNSGHVAIVTSADEYGMNVVDQNGQSSPAHIVKSTSFKYSYGTFYGVIRPDFDRIPPEISNVTVSNKTSNGYTVTCKVSDDVGVTQVKCPTWNEADGSDNCIWYDAVNNGNGTWTFTFIDALKPGNYITHIYAYDAVGNYSSKSIKAQTISKNLSKPTIKSTDIISGKKISISSKENADIYYKLSKKGKYKKYSAPFNISSTKTIYAYAKYKGCKNSKTSIKKVSLAKLSKPSRLKAKSI
ncbi:MAG: GBS Bsp-like repeat-containing protein, partial [Eubacterium sp.]